jgi:hypothetical protein
VGIRRLPDEGALSWAVMKREMGGGSHRGPVAVTRQRRTIRLVQLLLVAIAAGLFVFAGYSLGRVAGYDDGRRADRLDAPRRPSAVQTVVLLALGGAAIGAAAALGTGGPLRLPTPARLEELVGRAEATAIRRAEEAGSEARPGHPRRSP